MLQILVNPKEAIGHIVLCSRRKVQAVRIESLISSLEEELKLPPENAVQAPLISHYTVSSPLCNKPIDC
jgi:hypothetical protein